MSQCCGVDKNHVEVTTQLGWSNPHRSKKFRRLRFGRLGQSCLLIASTQIPILAYHCSSSVVVAAFLLTSSNSNNDNWIQRSLSGCCSACNSAVSSRWDIIPSRKTTSLTFSRKTRSQARHFGTAVKGARPSTAALCLFFPRSETSQDTAASDSKAISSQSIEELKTASVTLPYRIHFCQNKEEADGAEEEELVVRFMTPEDIPKLVPLCIQEFGEGSPLLAVPQSTLQNIPWTEPGKMRVWWEHLCFEKTVAWTLQWKLRAYHPQKSSSAQEVEDPAMLVLTLRSARCDSQYDDGGEKSVEKIVGMVELSLQPPDCDRNPPALPIPLWVKESMARNTELGTLQGWVTNLLIDPCFRGLGYSKILMAACEGVAKTWNCQYIFLHADADIRSGRIPQRLYESLGYRIVTGQGKEEYSWAGTASGLDQFSSIRMVDGAALLCYSKKLQSHQSCGVIPNMSGTT
ncbi:acyl-CoA N-acyltransferase [Nitzschia inconspicua]|uniref:Acyl-CoA N-acyltransferase n=1 Tax=Nitzschia inconspicua TaxID=303405 RepID=A0A9K3PEQ9_9STRA|nr:acyl-CoA N-acyltransferase [Nitzschia inconspicua]